MIFRLLTAFWLVLTRAVNFFRTQSAFAAITSTSIASNANFHRIRVAKGADSDTGITLAHGLARDVIVSVAPSALAVSAGGAAHILPAMTWDSTNIYLTFMTLASSALGTYDVLAYGHSIITTDTT